MTSQDLRGLRSLEGRHVSVALDDGSRIDDCELVSVGRRSAPTLWLFTERGDTFVDARRVVELWEAH